MNWDAVAAIAELIGALGVIVTLIYLASQIRHGTLVTKASMAHSIAAAGRDWNKPIQSDPELAWIWQVGTEDPTKLSERERSQFSHLAFTFFRTFEDMHYQHLQGTLDDELWHGWGLLFGTYAKAPGLQAWWGARKPVFSPAFQRYIEKLDPVPVARVDDIVRVLGEKSDA
jgi:hypothetical protein